MDKKFLDDIKEGKHMLPEISKNEWDKCKKESEKYTIKRPCEVKNCTGYYGSITLFYYNIKTLHSISIDEYHKLFSKTDYHPVTEERCNICNDSLDDRIYQFIEKYNIT